MTALDDTIKKLNKSFRVGDIQLGVEYKEVEKIPFSSCRLNYMTYGGLPVGRICEFSGGEGCGKTTTALDIVAHCQEKYPDDKVLFIDVERTFDSNWAQKLGVNIENLLYFNPESQGAEETFQAILDLMDTGEIKLGILDSIGAMVSEQANNKDVGEKTYGGISQSLTVFSKKLIPILSRHNATFIGINQVRDDMNSMYGGTVTTGGRAWRHNCTTRLEFRKGEYLDEKGGKLSRACENPQGNKVNVHMIKSKVCPQDRKVSSYNLNYMTGIDYISDLFDVGVQLGVIHASGAWYTFIDDGGCKMLEDEKEIKINGKANTCIYIKEHEELYNYLNDFVLNNLGSRR